MDAGTVHKACNQVIFTITQTQMLNHKQQHFLPHCLIAVNPAHIPELWFTLFVQSWIIRNLHNPNVTILNSLTDAVQPGNVGTLSHYVSEEALHCVIIVIRKLWFFMQIKHDRGSRILMYCNLFSYACIAWSSCCDFVLSLRQELVEVRIRLLENKGNARTFNRNC